MQLTNAKKASKYSVRDSIYFSYFSFVPKGKKKRILSLQRRKKKKPKKIGEKARQEMKEIAQQFQK